MQKSSISQLFSGLARGDERAQEKICEAFLRRIIGFVRRKLGIEDAEDVALAVLRSFLSAVQQDRFPHLSDRDALWSILAAIAAQKIVDEYRRQGAEKRGGKRKDGAATAESDGEVLERLAIDHTDPLLEVTMQDLLDYLLQLLPDDRSRSIIRLRFAGESVPNIATQLGVSRRTVERDISMARTLWEDKLE